MKAVVNYYLKNNVKKILGYNILIAVFAIISILKIHSYSLNIIFPMFFGFGLLYLIYPFFVAEFKDDRLNLVSSFPLTKDELVMGILGYEVVAYGISFILQGFVIIIANIICGKTTNIVAELAITLIFTLMVYLVIVSVCNIIFFKFKYERATKYSSIVLMISVFIVTMVGIMSTLGLQNSMDNSMLNNIWLLLISVIVIGVSLLILKLVGRLCVKLYKRGIS